eukprot:2694984-Prorocentrum_lima.AAC.1
MHLRVVHSPSVDLGRGEAPESPDAPHFEVKTGRRQTCWEPEDITARCVLHGRNPSSQKGVA